MDRQLLHQNVRQKVSVIKTNTCDDITKIVHFGILINVLSWRQQKHKCLFWLLRLFDKLSDVIIDSSSTIVSKIYCEKWKFIFCAFSKFGPLAISNSRVGQNLKLHKHDFKQYLCPHLFFVQMGPSRTFKSSTIYTLHHVIIKSFRTNE